MVGYSDAHFRKEFTHYEGCWAHARDQLGWRRIARVGTARISLQQPTLIAHSKTCRHILLAGQHLYLKSKPPFLLSARSDASLLSCRASCERITVDRWDTNRGSLGVRRQREECPPCLQGSKNFGKESKLWQYSWKSSVPAAGEQVETLIISNREHWLSVARNWYRDWINHLHLTLRTLKTQTRQKIIYRGLSVHRNP